MHEINLNFQLYIKNFIIFLVLQNEKEISLTYTPITRRNGVELIIVQIVLS